MRKLSPIGVLAAVVPLLLLGGTAAASAPGPGPAGPASPRAHRTAPDGVGPAALPLSFQRNEGQAAGQVRYLGQAPGVTVLFTSAGVTLDLAGRHGGGQAPGFVAVAIDGRGDAYLAGNVQAESIPVTAGAYQTDCVPNDPVDDNVHPNCVAVAEFSPAGTALRYSSYFGGNQNLNTADVSDLAIDTSGRLYLAGFASPGTIPTTADAFQPDPDPSVILPFYLAVLGKGTLLYSTYFGGAGLQVCSLFCAIDGSISIAPHPGHGSVFFGGTAETGMPVTPGAFQQADKARINTTWAARLSLPFSPAAHRG